MEKTTNDSDESQPETKVVVTDFAPLCCKAHGVGVRKDRPCLGFKNLLTPDECKAMIEHIKDRHAKEAVSLAPGSRSQFRMEDKKLSEKIWGRIKKYLPEKLDDGVVIGLRAGWNHARYFPGQSVFAHMDQRQASKEQGADATIASRMSLTIYLDEGYEGAEFVFCKGVQLDGSYQEEVKVLKPKAGDAVIFYQGVPEFFHAVPPQDEDKIDHAVGRAL